MRRRTAARRARGLCTRCGKVPALPDTDNCEACRDYYRVMALARFRRNSAARRAAGLCVRCGERPPGHGTLECGPCKDKQRAIASRGMPELPAQYTVIELATGADHGTWDSVAEVAAALAYAKLSLEDVEIVTDHSPTATLIAW